MMMRRGEVPVYELGSPVFEAGRWILCWVKCTTTDR